MLKPKNSVKQQHWMDSQLDVYLNLRPHLSMTRSILNPPLEPLGLVLIGNNLNGFTQAVELNWNFKIGIQVTLNLEKDLLTVTVAHGTIMGSGMIYRATTTFISFVSFSNSCWILLWWCSDDGWKGFLCICTLFELLQYIRSINNPAT